MEAPRGAVSSVCLVAYELPDGTWLFAAANPASVEETITVEHRDPGVAFARLRAERARRTR